MVCASYTCLLLLPLLIMFPLSFSRLAIVKILTTNNK